MVAEAEDVFGSGALPKKILADGSLSSEGRNRVINSACLSYMKDGNVLQSFPITSRRPTRSRSIR